MPGRIWRDGEPPSVDERCNSGRQRQRGAVAGPGDRERVEEAERWVDGVRELDSAWIWAWADGSHGVDETGVDEL